MTEYWRRPIVGQLLRYGIGGLIGAAIYSIVYLGLVAAFFPGRLAVLAVLPAFVIAATSGLYIHSNWSFRGHRQHGRGHGLTIRFMAVQVAGLAMTTAMTWVITAIFLGPAWVAILPSVLVTPLVTFYLQRRWVFAV